MRWSKLKQKTELSFADSVRKRISIYSAAYGACTCGHAWLTLDGKIIANFCTRAHYNRYKWGDKDRDQGVTAEREKRYKEQFVAYGEISRQDVYEACWAYIHEISFEDAIQSTDPLVQSLAVLDRRMGKRRYAQLEEADLHPLARKLLQIRIACELVTN